MNNIVKKCTVCKVEKSLDEFVKDKHTKCGKTAACKECRRKMTRKWVAENPEKYLQIRKDYEPYRKEYYQRPDIKLKHRKKHIERKYRIPYEQYEEMAKKQNNLCAICGGKEKDERNEHLAVDHCHKSDKIRELLCSRCNRAIGLLDENINIIENIIKYLKKHAN